MITWLFENKEWLLSGIFVSVPLAAIGWYMSKSSSDKKQTQVSGNNSRNLQAGKNLNVTIKKDD